MIRSTRRCAALGVALLAAASAVVARPALATSEPTDADGDPVTIAMLTDESGVSALPTEAVVQATVDHINATGGLAGHPIDLQVWDLKSDANVAQGAVAELPDDVIAVILNSQSTESSIADSLSELGVPIIGLGTNPGVWGGSITAFQTSCASDPGFCANPNFFTTSTTFDAIIAVQVIAAQAAGATKVSSASCAEVDSCSAAEPVFAAIAAELGLESSPTIKVNSSATDYSAECIAFMQEGVDYIQVSASTSTLVNLVASCLDQGYEGIFGATAGSVNATALGVPAVVAGGLTGFPWFVDDPLVEQYRSVMGDAGVGEDLYGSPIATGQYASLLLLQQAVVDYADPAAALDGAAALAAMYQVTDEDLGGLLPGAVTFREDDLDRTQPCFWPYIKDADGNLSNPNGGITPSCYPDDAGTDESTPPGT